MSFNVSSKLEGDVGTRSIGRGPRPTRPPRSMAGVEIASIQEYNFNVSCVCTSLRVYAYVLYALGRVFGEQSYKYMVRLLSGVRTEVTGRVGTSPRHHDIRGRRRRRGTGGAASPGTEEGGEGASVGGELFCLRSELTVFNTIARRLRLGIG